MLFTNRDLLKLTLPMLLQNVLATIVGMIDSLMVAGIGEAAVSGVSLINSLDIVLITFFSSMAVGGTVIVSQFLGKGNTEKTKDAVKQLVYVTTAAAVLITLFGQFFRVPMLHLFFGDAEEIVMHYADRYFLFVSLSFPLLGIANASGAALRAMGNTTAPMLISLIENVVNIILNAVFIYGLDMETAGAAIATTISRVVGAAILFAMLLNKKQNVHIERPLQYRPDFVIIKNILRIGIPNAIENCMFSFGKLLTQSVVSSLGTASITANSVANNLANYQYTVGGAVGSSAIIVVGRSIGAEDKKQAKIYSRKMLFAAYVCIWIVALVTAVFARPIIGFWQLSAETTELTRSLILYHCVCAALVWPIGFVLPSIFRAASDVKFPMIVSILCMWLFRVALSYVFAPAETEILGITLPGLNMGVMGVWVAMTIDWVFRVALYAWRYFSGKWMTVYDKLKS
ncbi:MAG: MATE family efflux transporter [Clostridia bacterium]|nr:MATE family efflux transporter [Clostridia bacterium]